MKKLKIFIITTYSLQSLRLSIYIFQIANSVVKKTEKQACVPMDINMFFTVLYKIVQIFSELSTQWFIIC